jgi:hypothetical protein
LRVSCLVVSTIQYSLLNRLFDEQVFSFRISTLPHFPGGISFGATITGRIQNIAVLLPLLGTQQCEEHIGSALTKGYLDAAIFGSLGVARAGFKTRIASRPGRMWSGAMIPALLEMVVGAQTQSAHACKGREISVELLEFHRNTSERIWRDLRAPKRMRRSRIELGNGSSSRMSNVPILGKI